MSCDLSLQKLWKEKVAGVSLFRLRDFQDLTQGGFVGFGRTPLQDLWCIKFRTYNCFVVIQVLV